MIESLNPYLPALTMIIGYVVWQIRLEGKLSNVEKRITEFTQIYNKLSEIAERLSFIEGNLKAHGRE